MAVAYFFNAILGGRPIGDAGNLGTFLLSGRLAAAGLNPYDVSSTPLARGVNLNPPISLVVFAAASRLDSAVLTWLWWGASLAAIVACLALLRRTYPRQLRWVRMVVLLGCAGLWVGLCEGQIYAVLAFVATTAWVSLRRRPVLAGMLMGILVAVKPNFTVWPALLLVSGMWTPALACGATALALSLVPVTLYGPAVYVSWLQVIGAKAPLDAYNASLPALFARLGIPASGTIVAAALVAAVGLWAWRRRPSVCATSSVAIVVALLASPIAWIMYFVFLFPIYASRRWTPAVWAAATLQLVPYWCLWLYPAKSGAGLVVAGMATNAVLLLLLADHAAPGRAGVRRGLAWVRTRWSSPIWRGAEPGGESFKRSA